MPEKNLEARRPDWWLVPNSRGQSVLLDLPEPFFNRYNKPERYDPGAALTSAVNIALLLGQPLLLTGEPGSGKTSLAFWLAYQMGLDRPLVHVVKSSTTGKDLLYSFDELARFRDAQHGPKEHRPSEYYLELNALGRAILFSAGSDARLTCTGSNEPGMARPLRHRNLCAAEFPTARRQLVLIDELDKAPRDTPNDLLNEIERMEFRIPEVGVTVRGAPEHRPVVIITSNSDKSLPEAFLRRCIYYNIPSPDDARRREIVELQRPKLLSDRPKLHSNAMQTFKTIQEGMRREGRSPGVAELLAWLDVVHAIYPEKVTAILDDEKAFGASLGALAKTKDDVDLIIGKLGLNRERLGLA